jgi:hypothetical protein
MSRQHDQLVEERKRLAAQGNTLFLSQGFGSWKTWWRPQAFKALQRVVPQWLVELLQTWADLLRVLDEKIQKAKAALSKRWSGPRPKGAGANSLVQIPSELLTWDLYSSRRKIACLAGMVPRLASGVPESANRLGPLPKWARPFGALSPRWSGG